MYKKTFFAVIIYFLISCTSNKKVDFNITGQLKNLDGVRVVLKQDGKAIDTAVVTNNTFSLSAKLIDKLLCTISFESDFYYENNIKKKWGHPVDIFVEKNATYLFKANDKSDILYNNYTIATNSIIQNEFEAFNRELKNSQLKKREHLIYLGHKRDAFAKQRNLVAYGDYTDSIRIYEQELLGLRNKIVHDYVLRKPNSVVAVYLLSTARDLNRNLSFYKYVYQQLNEQYLSHPYGTNFKNSLETVEKMNSGKLSLEIAGVNPSGRKFNFNDYAKNKLLIFDFWATWCAPCLNEIPQSLILEKELKNKGISYIYVSYDFNKPLWVKTSTSLGLVNNFIITEKGKDYLYENLNITTIPRYVITNSKGVVLVSDAPAPSSINLKPLLQQMLIEN